MSNFNIPTCILSEWINILFYILKLDEHQNGQLARRQGNSCLRFENLLMKFKKVVSLMANVEFLSLFSILMSEKASKITGFCNTVLDIFLNQPAIHAGFYLRVFPFSKVPFLKVPFSKVFVFESSVFESSVFESFRFRKFPFSKVPFSKVSVFESFRFRKFPFSKVSVFEVSVFESSVLESFRFRKFRSRKFPFSKVPFFESFFEKKVSLKFQISVWFLLVSTTQTFYLIFLSV